MGRVYLIAIIAALASGAGLWFLHKRRVKKRRDSDTPFTGNADAQTPFRTCGAAKFRDEHWEHEARELARAGRKIEAIKLARERAGLDLKSAKEYVAPL
jgi:ribosomal protein L7/L12